MGLESPYDVVIEPWNPNHTNFEERLRGVVAVAKDSMISPWSFKDFRDVFSGRSAVGTVAIRGDEIIAYAVLYLRKNGIEICDLCVKQNFRRTGIASDVLGYIVTKALTTSVRKLNVQAVVRETNLAAQLFLKSKGFKCTQILPSHYEDTQEPAYSMVLHIRPSVKPKRTKQA